MGPSASRRWVTIVPLGHERSTKRRVSSGMGSRPWAFIDMGLPLFLLLGKPGACPWSHSVSLSLPHLPCSLVRTKFPNRVIYYEQSEGDSPLVRLQQAF